ncbi:MAG: hypothetical protein IJT91_05660 [Clostridia bacterium]|nr:hypothetical protein [Clostridia bacterium]
MKNSKKITAIIFAVIMIAAIIPFSAFAEQVDPARFFTAERNTITLLKDPNKVVLDMWVFKGDHSDVSNYKGLKPIKSGDDFIYSASCSKLELRDVPVTVSGPGVYTVVVRQKDGLYHSHAFELEFEHLLPSFAADAVFHIPADVRLIRYIEGDHSDMTMKELKAAGAKVICNSYFTYEANGEKYYTFKNQLVGTWTYAVQYEDGNVKTVVVENEEISEPINHIEKYGISFEISSFAQYNSFGIRMFAADSALKDQDIEIKIDLYEYVNRYYTDHLTYKFDGREWNDYYDGRSFCQLDSYMFAQEVNVPKCTMYHMIITLTINGESQTITEKVRNPGVWIS